MKQKLSFAGRIWIGFTLFSMFFGAGNLIFPPFLGYGAGEHFWQGLVGFLASAVGLPILGVGAVAIAGGLDKLAGRVHPKFSFIFSLLIYLSIGPFLAIPRTAGTSFEMAVLPLLGQGPNKLLQFIYTVFFFGAAFLLSLRPDKLSNRLGKVMTPALLFLVALIFVGCICWPVGQWISPLPPYRAAPVMQGFLEGYQTMDTMAALNFGIVITLNIRARGITKESAVVRETIYAGLIAGILLSLLYGALAYTGSIAGTGIENPENGARILAWVVNELYGKNGLLLLAVIFFIACFSVCVGLICCCSQYFCQIFPRIPYPAWAAVFSCISLGIANMGLTQVLAFSVPVIHTIYPIAIILIILSFIHPWIKHLPLIYPCCVSATAVVSIAENIGTIHLFDHLPGYLPGFGWFWPAVLGALFGAACSWIMLRKKENL